MGTMVVDLRRMGTEACCKERLKIFVKTPVSWSAQDLSFRPDTPSGLEALLVFIVPKVDLTW